ncbi:MAG: hypothetical protein ACYC8T_06895 [Myxococcaceae bacterium]
MSNNVKQGPPKAGQPPAPSAPAAPADSRPRAQVAYEGDDEFSVMSSKAGARRKPTVELRPASPGQTATLGSEDNEGAGKNKAWHFIRKIFGQ